MLVACLEAPNCKSFEVWNFTDKYSWLPDPQDGLPFDRQMKPKVAYDSLFRKLKSFPRNHRAVVERVTGVKPDSEI